jgi:hypothetical protein
MLAEDAASHAAWLGENGALAAMSSGSIAIECSTLSPDWIRELNVAVLYNRRDLRNCPSAPGNAKRSLIEIPMNRISVWSDEERGWKLSSGSYKVQGGHELMKPQGASWIDDSGRDCAVYKE